MIDRKTNRSLVDDKRLFSFSRAGCLPTPSTFKTAGINDNIVKRVANPSDLNKCYISNIKSFFMPFVQQFRLVWAKLTPVVGQSVRTYELITGPNDHTFPTLAEAEAAINHGHANGVTYVIMHEYVLID